MVDAILSVDEALLRQVLALPHPAWLNLLMRGASYAGVGGAIWLATAVALALARVMGTRDVARVVIAIALVHLVVDGLVKPWVDRPRPAPVAETLSLGVDMPETKSFPSGHAANSIAAAIVLHRYWKRGRWVIWTGAVLVAIARVYLGVHYPLDVGVGCLVGVACGLVALMRR